MHRGIATTPPPRNPTVGRSLLHRPGRQAVCCHCVSSIERRLIQGALAQVHQLIQHTQGEGGINTAYIERLNAAFSYSIQRRPRRSPRLTG